MIWANRSLDLITIGSAIYDNNFFLSWSEQTWQTVTVHGSVCSFCVRLCGWTRSLCLSALPSDRAPDEVIRTVTGVARLHCLYLAGVSVVRCQIVFTLVVFLLSVSVFQVRRLFSPGRVSVFPWRVRTGLYSLPELETLHCRVYCTCTAGDICTSTVFWSLHLHCQLIFTSTVFWSCQIKIICFHSQLDLELSVPWHRRGTCSDGNIRWKFFFGSFFQDLITKYSKYPHRCGEWQQHIHHKTLDSSAPEPCSSTAHVIKIIPHPAAISGFQTKMVT